MSIPILSPAELARVNFEWFTEEAARIGKRRMNHCAKGEFNRSMRLATAHNIALHRQQAARVAWMRECEKMTKLWPCDEFWQGREDIT